MRTRQKGRVLIFRKKLFNLNKRKKFKFILDS